ncbi:hypothetical protein G4O51_12000 [Candidatus Bathyarchaeota archaeon A05DMB-2]|jgi:hypothetical protein|nr:hypothetical protein [Candidatus Bathyarchaeota archaeon A05DMB-2]
MNDVNTQKIAEIKNEVWKKAIENFLQLPEDEQDMFNAELEFAVCQYSPQAEEHVAAVIKYLASLTEVKEA